MITANMKMSDGLLKILNRTYEPSRMVNTRFKGKDVAFKTDDKGNPVLLFIGQADAEGNIKGERFVRTLKTGNNNEIIKDHWELKGKAS